MIWTKAINTWPENFRLCDGTHGTPNLADRFIVGASTSGSYRVLSTGSQDHYRLHENHLPQHNHPVTFHNKDGHYKSGMEYRIHTTGSYNNCVARLPTECRNPTFVSLLIHKDNGFSDYGFTSAFTGRGDSIDNRP